MKMKKFTRKIKNKMNKKNKKVTELSIEKLKNMRDEAKKLTDPRIKKKCTYKILDIVCVVIIATIANCNEWEEIYDFAIEHRKWLRSFLLLTGGIPTAKTYENIMTIIDPNELQKLCHYIYEELIIQSGYEGAYKKEIEKSHSQIITYEYYQTEKVKWYEGYEKWEKLKSLGVVVKTMVGIDGKNTIEKRYYISSLLLDIKLFSEAIRKHWSVENKLHWQMDFTFKCDNNTTSNKKALFNLQIIKKNALNILNIVKEDYGKCSLKRIRFKVGMNPEREIPKIFYLVKEKMANL